MKYNNLTIAFSLLLWYIYVEMYNMIEGINGTARHTENKEELMIDKPLYLTECTNGVDFAARPLEMFM